MAHVSTHRGRRSRHPRARRWGRRGLGARRRGARPPSPLCLRRWSRCLRGSSSITPSAWGRRCSATAPSPAPPAPPATSSASSNSSASPEPGRAGGEPSRDKASERDALPPRGPAPDVLPEPAGGGTRCCGTGTGRGRCTGPPHTPPIAVFIPRELPGARLGGICCVLVWRAGAEPAPSSHLAPPGLAVRQP